MSAKHVCSKSTTVGYAAAAFVAGVGTAALARFLYNRATQTHGAKMTTEAVTTALAGSSSSGLVPIGEPIPDDVEVVSREDKYVGKWIKYSLVKFFSPSRMREACSWERVERTQAMPDVDGADAIAVVKTPGQADQLVLLLSYRAAVEGITVELPSGLVDAGESALVSAVRELREETGYVGTAVATSGKQWVDCWKSTETCRHVFITVDGTLPENQNPAPQREAEELQQVVLVPLTNLQQTLNHFETEKNYLIDSRLRCLAMGLELRGHGIM